MPSPPPASATQVTVGCKLPNGLIIQVEKTKVMLNGSNATKIIGGYGLTYGVDASFMTQWLALNANSPLVKKGIVFVQEKEVNAKAQAQDTKTVATGLEPMAPANPQPGVSQGVPLDPGQKIEQELRVGEKPPQLGQTE